MSGLTSRPGIFMLFSSLSLFLGTILRPALMPRRHAFRVQGAANDMVPNPRQILDASTSHQHHRVLLQVVPFAPDVGGDFLSVAHADARDFPQRRVRLL